LLVALGRRADVAHVHARRSRHDTARRPVETVDLPTVAAVGFSGEARNLQAGRRPRLSLSGNLECNFARHIANRERAMDSEVVAIDRIEACSGERDAWIALHIEEVSRAKVRVALRFRAVQACRIDLDLYWRTTVAALSS
jgi:hypothetical protein